MNIIDAYSKWLKLGSLALIIGLFFGFIFIRNNEGFKAKLFSSSTLEPTPRQIDNFTIKPQLSDTSVFASMDDMHIPTETGILIQTYTTLETIFPVSAGIIEISVYNRGKLFKGLITPDTTIADADYYLDKDNNLQRIGVETVEINRLDQVKPGQWLRLTYNSEDELMPTRNILELVILE